MNSTNDSQIVSVITSHNSRIQCFVAKIFDELKNICKKHNSPLKAINTYISQLQKPNDSTKTRNIRFKNCAILELILNKDRISLSLIYEGSLNEVSKNAYYDIRQDSETDVIFPHFNIPSTNTKVYEDFNTFLKQLIPGPSPSEISSSNKDYIFYLVRHGEGIHNRYKKQKTLIPGFDFASNVCKLKKKLGEECDINNFDLKDPRLTTVFLDGGSTPKLVSPFDTYNTGEEQAKIAGKRLQLFLKYKNITQISYFFCSQLLRTRETLVNINSELLGFTVPDTIIILPCSSEHNKAGKEGNCDKMLQNISNIISATENQAYCPNPTLERCVSIQQFKIIWDFFKDPNVKCKDYNMLQYAIKIINNPPQQQYIVNTTEVSIPQAPQEITPGISEQQQQPQQEIIPGIETQQQASQEITPIIGEQQQQAPQEIRPIIGEQQQPQEVYMDALPVSNASQLQPIPAIEQPHAGEVYKPDKLETMYKDYNTAIINKFNSFLKSNTSLDYRVNPSVNALQNYLNESFSTVLPERMTGGSNGNAPNTIQRIKDEIKSYINKDLEHCVQNKKWVDCSDKCYNFISKLFELELGSTIYNLNCIFKSVLNDPENTYIEVEHLSDELTGLWETDKQHINLKINESSNISQDTHKLIMGFGPSASGKTYIARTIINLLANTNNGFPTKFLSIDGGIYRELSVIYQTIITVTKQYNIAGITNLVSAFSVGQAIKGIKTLFDSNIVKKNICDFLLEQQKQYLRKHNFKEKGVSDKGFINLYVPETLGECLTKGKIATLTASCKPLIKNYRDITRDDENWVALLIWQHKNGKYIDCQFAPKYHCVGCVNSGKSREETEGKKYSSASYENSIKYGTDTMKTTKGYKFKIHNTGGNNYMDDTGTLQKSITIIQDFTEYSNDNKEQKNAIKEYIQKNPSFLYIEKDEFIPYCLEQNKQQQQISRGGRKTRRKNNKKRQKTRRYK